MPRRASSFLCGVGRSRGSDVLVTGGAGFIGSHLCDALIERGKRVVCVDNLVGTDGSTRNIDHLIGHPCFQFVSDSFEDWLLVADLSGFDCVYHQAASKMVVSLTDPELDLKVNGLGALRLLIALREARVRKAVFASTGSVCGPPVGKQDESHRLRPVSLYGCSKLLAEAYCHAAAHLFDLDITVLRYFHVIGPRQNDSSVGGVAAIFVKNCLNGEPLSIFGTGEQVRSFTSVHDVVAANLRAANDPRMSNQIVNCASGLRVTVQELAEFVRDETGANVPIEYSPWRAGDIVNFDVDNSFGLGLGLAFTTDWKAVVRETIGYARNATPQCPASVPVAES